MTYQEAIKQQSAIQSLVQAMSRKEEKKVAKPTLAKQKDEAAAEEEPADPAAAAGDKPGMPAAPMNTALACATCA